MPRFGTESGRNNGYGKSMSYALSNAIEDKLGEGHFGSKATYDNATSQFAKYAKEQGVKDTREVTPELVKDFAQSQIDKGNAVSTAHTYVTAVNQAMSQMQSRWQTVSAAETVGSRSFVREDAPASLDRNTFNEVKDALQAQGHDRAAVVVDLARESGMRLSEAIKADLPKMAEQAREAGRVNIAEVTNTKGGRDADRFVTATPALTRAIENAINHSPQGSNNLIAPNESYKDVKQELDNARDTLKEHGVSGYHDFRSAYACERYEEKTGYEAPCVSSEREREADKESDREAREEISQELGHNREDVVSAYVGSSK